MEDIDLLHQIVFYDNNSDNEGSSGNSDNQGNGSGATEINAPPTSEDDRMKGFVKDDVVKDENGVEYICLDNKVHNAKWAYLIEKEEDLENTGTGYKAFIQESQTLWEFDNTNGQWFVVDRNLCKKGLMKIDEVWDRPYNKIPAGYVQFVYGLEVQSDITLQVEGELIDLKERL